MTTAVRSLLDYRLVVVTGKGGVGKTTVACMLAEAARRAGRSVLLAETAPIASIAGFFESDPRPLDYTGRAFRPGLHAIHVDPHEALADYLRLQTGLGMVTDRVIQTEIFRQLLEAAPGWRELIVLGKIWHVEQKRQADGSPLYDLIVVDAPATGHGLTFLDVPRVVQQAVRAGPLARHASWVEALIHDRERTLLLPVTLPEELPVIETLELVERARGEIDIGIDRVVVNRMPAHPLDRIAPALEKLPDDLDLECLPKVPELRALLRHAVRRDAVAREERARVSTASTLPIVDLPYVADRTALVSGTGELPLRILEAPVWPDAEQEGVTAA